MNLRKIFALASLGALALGASALSRAYAQQPPIAGIVGEHPSSVAGCPTLNWRLARHDNGKITGIFWYSDLSGASSAVGMMQPDGHFTTTLTSFMGDGPVGTVVGSRSNNHIVADLKGEGCANYHMEMTLVPDFMKGFHGGGD